MVFKQWYLITAVLRLRKLVNCTSKEPLIARATKTLGTDHFVRAVEQ